MTEDKGITRSDFQHEVVKMAVEDKEFRRQLLANPKEALKSATGLELPPGTELQVLQEDPTHTYIVLPPETAGELGDDELEAVAGGAQTLQAPTFVRGDFATRFNTESLSRAGGAMTPGGQAAVTVQWG